MNIFVRLFVGITSPMVKVEMVLSAETWKTPSHDFYTLEYLHQGERKIWYSVPNCSKERFLEMIKAETNDEACDIKDFMVRILLGFFCRNALKAMMRGIFNLQEIKSDFT